MNTKKNECFMFLPIEFEIHVKIKYAFGKEVKKDGVQ